MKLYFSNIDGELCYPLEHHLEEAIGEGLDTITLHEAEKLKDNDIRWCGVDEFVFDRSSDNPCGRDCNGYDPTNGKSGRCKHLRYTYTPVREVVFDTKTGKEISPSSTRDIDLLNTR